MSKQSITDLDKQSLANKKVLVRVDFNVPIENGEITDDSRIQAALPTLNYLLDNKATCIVTAHLGRPKGKVDEAFRLNIVADRLKQLINTPLLKLDDCIGDSVQETINNSDIKLFLLENVRFYKEETNNDQEFAKKLAGLADVFVQDAFGVVHRAHASTHGVARFLPAYSGFLVDKELTYLQTALTTPKRPFVAIVGGSKVSTKIGVLSNLLDSVDELIIGGAMAFTFLKAQGYSIGKSLCEEDKCDLALDLIKKARSLGKQLILPKDIVVAESCDENSDIDIVPIDKIPDNKMGLDVGPESLMDIKTSLENAQTVLWNGPLGVFEIDVFAKGTCAVARYLSESNAVSIIGGGDSVAAVKKVGMSDKMDHISTGGGACLEFLEGKELPGIACLRDKT